MQEDLFVHLTNNAI